ncbi:DNA polymerase III subunit gamma/tau [Slackia piriformis]|uniref:DNA polymerase III subunit gamma/tau n=1 Tax=Slackia piriformis TaxID=626934 RepID=UPI002F92BC2B
MAEALYRKYRPQTFEDVVGQTHIERTLKNAIESDKVSHAYLFCGPRGTGKTTTARLLAKALLCEHGPTPSPDGTCEQCLAIAEGNHPDVNELDAASRTGVENVREEIIGRVQYAPTRGRYKIYIIDEVHMLSTAAFNALLKTLEEPPSHVVFVLCTTDPQKVPETIHSRCQRFDFHRLSNDEIVSRLGAVCMAEGVEFEGDALDLAAHRAQGGMRDALTTLEQLIAFGGGKVTLEVAQSVLGSIDATDISTVVNGIVKRDAAACFTWLSEYVETGADLARFARDLAAYIRDLYVLCLTDGALAVDAPQASRASMAAEAQAFGADRLSYVLRVLGDLNNELRTSTNPRLSFEIALTRMVRPESDLTLEALAARIAALEQLVASGSLPSSAATSVEALRPRESAGNPSVRPSAGSASPIRNQESISDASHPFVEDGSNPMTMRVSSTSASSGPARREISQPQTTPQMQASVPPVSGGFRSPEQRPAPSQPSSAVVPPATVMHAAAAMDRAAAFRAKLEERRAANAAARQAGATASRPPAFSGGAYATSSAAVSAPESALRADARGGDVSMPHFDEARDASSAALSREGSDASAAALSQDAPISSGEASADVRAKLSDPSALQRCWKAAIADLKRQRAAYGALLLSARASVSPDGAKLLIEFSQENTFAFSAAQKPDFAQAASSALQAAFGGFVPFEVIQAASAFAPRAAGGRGFGQGGQAPASSAPTSFGGAPSYEDDDWVPYTDADVASYADDEVPYDDADAFSYGEQEVPEEGVALAESPAPAYRAPWDAVDSLDSSQEAPQKEPASPTFSASFGSAESMDAAFEVPSGSDGRIVLGVAGPEPVDPYIVGKKLGFDSMPQPKKRHKGMIDPKGWPERGVDVSQSNMPALSQEPAGSQVVCAGGSSSQNATDAAYSRGIAENADAGAEASDQDGAAERDATGTAFSSPREAGAAASPMGTGAESADTVAAASFGAVPARPNPFASRPMPAGIGAQKPDEQTFSASGLSHGNEMDVADIFGSFGVSFDSVQEE